MWREGQEKLAERELPPGRLGVVLAKEPAREAIAARRQADQMLAKLTRGDDYAELPGTQVEIARLAALFDAKSVTTLTRADASEERLDELRRAGKLKQFRYLHLATHGQGNDIHAFESALILTKPAKPPEVRVGEPYLDGRLTAAEVLEYWKLDAELVTLSACESGLGRKGGGDGLLGFAQAFLLAGSRSVCLTLWQVDDTATALLMDRFYRNLLGKREDGAKAHAQGGGPARGQAVAADADGHRGAGPPGRDHQGRRAGRAAGAGGDASGAEAEGRRARTTSRMRIRATGPRSSSSATQSERGGCLPWRRPWGSRSRRSGNSTRASAEDLMQRMLLVALLGLSLAVAVRADDPRPGTKSIV